MTAVALIVAVMTMTAPPEAPLPVRRGRADSYYVASGQGGGMGGGGNGAAGAAGAIQAWVRANYTATTVGGTTVFKLTG